MAHTSRQDGNSEYYLLRTFQKSLLKFKALRGKKIHDRNEKVGTFRKLEYIEIRKEQGVYNQKNQEVSTGQEYIFWQSTNDKREVETEPKPTKKYMD